MNNLEEHPLSFKLLDPRIKLHVYTFEETLQAVD